MVKGLEIFKEHFKNYNNSYTLIGGTACYLVMDEVGEEFRATKDLDIVLIVEVLDTHFVQAFWGFIKLGRYKNKMKGSDKKLFYRFEKPEDKTFPYMLELFSRKPDSLIYEGEGLLTPLPIEDDVSSLSAILLDDEYYSFLKLGNEIIGGLSVLGTSYLIPFKAKAWLDLKERRDRGEKIDSKNINKHKNDILRLTQIVSPEAINTIPDVIRKDMELFLKNMSEELIDLKSLGISGTTWEELRSVLQGIYDI